MPRPAGRRGRQADDKAAATPEAAAEELRKAVQNPAASLISVPLQNNTNFDIGPYDRTQNVLNIQPVIPVHITKNWNLITRIIQPIVWQPYPDQSTGGELGFGDMNPTFFLSLFKPGKLIWGAGPTASGLHFTQFHTTALLLPHACGAPRWSQPPFQRHRRHHGTRHGLPGLQLADAQGQRNICRSAQAERGSSGVRNRMPCHVETQNLATVMADYEEPVQHSECEADISARCRASSHPFCRRS
jgi:hypothetical protein